MVNDELNKGDDYRNIEPTYQIIFITDESKEEQLVDIYMSRNEKGRAEKYNLIHRAYVYIDYIEEILKEKKVEELTEFEKLVYIFKKGLDDGIIDVESKVKRYMGEKYKEFKNTDEGMRHLAFQREMWQWQTKQEQLLAKREKEERERQDREREEKDKERERMDKERELQDQERARIDLELQEREKLLKQREENLQKQIDDIEKNTLQYQERLAIVCELYKELYSSDDTSLFNECTFEQLKVLTKMLIKKTSIEEINNYIKNG